MRSKLSLLVKDGLNKKINTKWFKVINIILLVVTAIIGVSKKQINLKKSGCQSCNLK